jgi:hypothetical protein
MRNSALPRATAQAPPPPALDDAASFGLAVPRPLLARRLWPFEAPNRGRQGAMVFEHAATVGGFAMAALLASERSPR